MADDITLTVRVRDLSRGDFQRLDRQLDRMRRDLRGVSRDTESAGMHSRRLGNDIQGLSTRFQQMQRSGNMTRRELTQLRSSLDAMSHSARNAARSGEITQERYHSLGSEIRSLRAQFDYLGRGLDTTRTRIRRVGSTNTTGTLRNLGTAARNAGDGGTFAGKAFGNMHSKLIGIGVLLIATLLPTIGALAPMLAGLGAVVGVAALAFSGLSAPTKFLTKDQKDFLAALKPVRKEFGNLRKAAQESVLPKLTKSFGDVTKMVKALNPVIKIAGDTFGTLVGKIARGVSSKDFMGPFVKNVRMGTKWLNDFTKSFGTFSIEFLKFGTKSQPALDAWQNLLGGFLDRGLPSMFQNMEKGIGGSSDYLNGLAFVINDSLLPSLGKLLASFMKTFGPFMEQALIVIGNAFNGFADNVSAVMDGLAPIMSVVTDMFRAFNAVAAIGAGVFADLASVLGGALLGTLQDLGIIDDPFGNLTNGFRGFSNWVKNNEVPIRNAFSAIGQAVIVMVRAALQVLPLLMEAFQIFATTAIEAVGLVVNAFAASFGNIPGPVGEMFRNMATGYNTMASEWIGKLDVMSEGVDTFVAKADANLQRTPLTLNVTTAKRNLESIKAALKDPELTKERKAKLTADKKVAEQVLAKAKGDLAAFDQKRAEAKIAADASGFWGVMRRAIGAKLPKKSGMITANDNSFWATVSRLSGRVLGTSYINVQMRKVESSVQPRFGASGFIARGKAFANGGMEDHQAQIAPAGAMRVWAEPETGGEAYIPLSVTKRSRSRQIASDTVDRLGGSVEWFAKGGLTKKQKAARAAAKEQAKNERSARNSAVGDLTISHFGKMAGFKTDEFKHALGLPASLGGLVDDLNHWRSVIKKSTHGGVEKSLLKQLDRAGRSLIRYDKSLNKVEKSLDKAKTKLDDLKQASSALRDSVTSGVISSTDITRAAGGSDKNVTVTDLMSTMREGSDKASAFSDSLSRLKKRGVSKDIIKQIAEAGISGGGLETAGAMLGASDSEIKSMNDMQKKINASAKSAGKTASGAMYGAGIKAAEGLVKGLTKKKKDIEKAMMAIAKSMEKAIKHALGIHSPSRVMQEIGHYTAEGFAVGIKKNRSVDTAWSSMLTTAPSSSGGSATGGNGVQVIQLNIGNKPFDEIVLDSNRRTVRTRGGNVQAVLGK